MLARGVVERHAERVKRTGAATCIQAAFRGWRWRMRELFNPHIEVGRAHLAREFSRIQQQQPKTQ